MKSIGKYIGVILATVFVLLCFCSCSKEIEMSDLPRVPEGSVRLQIESNSEDVQAPVVGSRAGSADENTIGSMPWVFIFDGSTGTATLVEVQQAYQSGIKTYVTVKARAAACQIVVIANPPATFGSAIVPAQAFTQANLLSVFNGKTLDYVRTNLLTRPLLAATQTTIPYTSPSSALPMSALLAVPKIDETVYINSTGASGGSSLLLQRIVAKVTVDATRAAGPNFTMLGVGTVNAPKDGALLATTTIKSNNVNLCNYFDSSNDVEGIVPNDATNTTDANPIYIYETGETAAANLPSLVIKGTYTDSNNNSTTGYYRAVFVDGGGNQINVVRNKQYTFVISSVNGPGYSTIAEAISAPPSPFMNVVVTVTDVSSYEMSDNGQYYLGLSNSELLIYAEGAVPGYGSSYPNPAYIPTVTIVTNAPTGVTTRSISVSGTGMMLKSSNQVTVNGNVATTNVLVAIDATFTAGQITIKVGNLTKTVQVERRSPNMGPFADPVRVDGQFVGTGNITYGFSMDGSPGAGPGGSWRSNWLTMSYENDQWHGQTNLISDTGQPIYLFMKPMMFQSTSNSMCRTALFYAYRTDHNARSAIYLQQSPGYALPINARYLPNTYVGAFYRWNQTGERVIKIDPLTLDATANANLTGSWKIKVIAGEFIKLSQTPSSDPNIYTDNPADMSTLANDAMYQVPGYTQEISGNYDGVTPIIFRIGLTDKLPSAESAPRYGALVLTYNNGQKYHIIWVRQGENPDGIFNTSKVCAFNLSDPKKGLGGPAASNHNKITPQGDPTIPGVFTDYPSQAGYMFQWGNGDPANIYAFHPTNPLGKITSAPDFSGVYTLATDPCPAGYKDISSGDIGTGSTYNWGFYADGFFDRRQIKLGPTSITSGYNVTTYNTVYGQNSYDIAYLGYITVNCDTYASVFMPGAGRRDQGAHMGSLLNPGGESIFYAVDGTKEYLGTNLWTVGAFSMGAAAPWRCVKLN